MVFQVEEQRIPSNDVLEAIARGDEIRLSNCTVSGNLDIGRLLGESYDTSKLDFVASEGMTTVTLHQIMVFHNCVFEGDVAFGPTFAEPESLRVIFKRDVSFNSSQFRQQTRFHNAVFTGLAGFDGCVFDGVVALRVARFEASARFRTCRFRGYCLLNDTIFEKDVRFANTHFEKGVNFTHVRFRGSVDFSGAYSASRLVPAYDGVVFVEKRYGEDETFWRFIKQCALEAGHYQLAGETFYNERCANLQHRFHDRELGGEKRPAVRWVTDKIWLLLEFIVGKWLFGYGERPGRVLCAAAIVILASGLVYWLAGSLMFQEHTVQATLGDCLYFSVTTFTTLGFGDYYPQPGHLTRYVVMFETLSGAALTALFVVSLAKRFARS